MTSTAAGSSACPRRRRTSGPGFDAFAAALALHVEVEVIESGRFAVETKLDIARDRRNLCVRGFAKLHSPDNFTFRIRSSIPLSGGLGSSAAAYTAGVLAAAHMFELQEDLLGHVTELEGHPDNAAAALLGGFVIVTGGEVARFEPPDGLEAVIVVPRSGGPHGGRAQGRCPQTVPIADASRERRAWRDADARPEHGRLRPRRPRPAGPAAPALPRAPVSAVDGAAAARPRVRRDRRDPSPARARRCCSGRRPT